MPPKFPVLLLVAVFITACCLPAFAGDAPAAPSVQKSVQKSPVKNVPDLKVEMPTPVQQRQIQKTPVQKEVIKGKCEGPCCQQKSRFRFRQRTVIRERGRLLSTQRARVHVRAPGVSVSVGGGCCR